MFKTFETEFAGRKLSVEIGKYAEQANGSCLIRCGSPRRNCGDGSPHTRREGRDDRESKAKCEEVFLHAP